MAAMRFRFDIQSPDNNWQAPLAAGSLIVGRIPGSGLLLEDQLVSRQHARVTCSAGAVQITDLNSSNGTYVNGQKLVPNQPHDLNHTDVIKIGPFLLVLISELAAEEPAPLPEPEPEPPSQAQDEPVPVPVEVPLVQAVDQHGLAGGGGANGGPPEDDEAVDSEPFGFEPVPRGLTIRSQRLIHFLPGIYQTDFMERFLGIFESILIPIEWNVDNFDLFLDPGTAPSGFLPWLASWYGMLIQPQWSDAQRRAFLKRAHFLFAMRGTRLAMTELLQIFSGQQVEVDDTSPDLPANTFRVRLPLRKDQVDQSLISALIDAHKPAHTTYILEFSK